MLALCAVILSAGGVFASPAPQAVQPGVAPDVLLAAAERYLLNGFYETAVAAYQAVLAQGESVPPELRATATFGLGQAALREGFFQDAVSALDTFISQYPQDSRLAQAHFLRGDAHLGLSSWEAAIADFQQYLTLRPGLIDSYALERIADAQLALGFIDNALDNYKNAADSSRSVVPLVGLRERIAQVYISQRRFTEAIAQYDQILAVARIPAYRSGIEFLAAQNELESGAVEAALTRLQRIFDTYPDRPEAYSAMQALVQRGRTLDPLAMGRVQFNYGDYQGAIESFINFSTSRALTEVPAELHMLLGRAYREIGNTQAAVTAFQTVIDQYTTDPLFGEALLEQGRTRFVGGDIPGAVEQYLRIAEVYSYTPQAPEALWRAGYLLSTNEQPAEARVVFEQLADAFPNTQQAVDGLLIAASQALGAGELGAAERFYAEVAVKATGESQASAYLNVGRLALQRGDNNIATQALQAALAAAPDSYFGQRARDIAAGIAPFQRPANPVFQFDDAAEIAEAENWLRTTYGITQEGPLWVLSPTLENDPRIVRGRELWTVAQVAEARAEFADIITAYETDPLASYQLAIFLRGLAAYQNSIIAAANVIRLANVATLDAPPYLARMRYPAYYLDVVLESSNRYSIDPLLMFSLIRHESLFDTYATAAADEKGLTQVIPSTGDYIADVINFPDYQHSDLFRPYAGVEFGAYYLSENLNTFDGNVTAALSGYNAGPGRAIQWRDISGGDHDAFLDAITISSTRLYVQRIYTYYAIYRELFSAN